MITLVLDLEELARETERRREEAGRG